MNDVKPAVSVVIRDFFPKTLDKETGKERSIRVTLRTIYLKVASVLDSGDYRIVYRPKSNQFTISVIPLISDTFWDKKGHLVTETSPAPDYEDEDGNVHRPFVRTDDPPMGYVEILTWLRKRIGWYEADKALREVMS